MNSEFDVPSSRRRWLSLVSGTFATLGISRAGASWARIADENPVNQTLIVRSRRPIDLETRVSAFDEYLTRVEDFFVRSHLGEPAVGLGPWSLEISGLVDKPIQLGLDDLKGFEQVSITAVLQCAGNGRAFFKPIAPGLPWEKGAVGNAEWGGVRLADVLERAGVAKGAAHVHFLGADAAPSPKTPPYLRSLPIDEALSATTLLATSMNGQPLPHLHGGPIRLVVPCWTGNHWMKWVRSIKPAETEAPGLYNKTAYKMPKTPVGPDAIVKPEDMLPITFLNVKCLITSPEDHSKVRSGRVTVNGVAWTGRGVVNKVEVSTNLDPKWIEAAFLDKPRLGTWRRWTVEVDTANAKGLTIRSRAADSNGEVQPETMPWNKSGYLWNEIDSVTIECGGSQQ